MSSPKASCLRFRRPAFYDPVGVSRPRLSFHASRGAPAASAALQGNRAGRHLGEATMTERNGEVIVICSWGPRADSPTRREAPVCPGGRVQATPPGCREVSAAPDTAVNRKDACRSAEADAREQARGGRPGRMSGQRDYAAPRPVPEDTATGTPAGGRWAATGQSPRGARLFSITAGCSMKASSRAQPSGDDPHWPRTPRTDEEIHFVHFFDEPRPGALRD